MLIIADMNNLLNLFGVPPFLREAAKGGFANASVLFQRKESAQRSKAQSAAKKSPRRLAQGASGVGL